MHNNESSLRTVAAAAVIVVIEIGTAVIATVAAAVIGVVTAAIVTAVVIAVVATVIAAIGVFMGMLMAALDHLQFSITEFDLLFVLPEAPCIQVHVRMFPFYLHCIRLTVARTIVRKVQDMLRHIKQVARSCFSPQERFTVKFDITG